MEAIKMLKTRQSERSYLPYSIDLKIIEDIIDCARLSASVRNIQPWHFVVIDDISIKDKIVENVPNGKFFKTCPVVIATFCEDGDFMVEDGCAATQNLLNAAHAHGLGSCWVAGYNKPYASTIEELLSCPKSYKLISLVSIGFIDKKATRPQKKPLSNVMSYNKFE